MGFEQLAELKRQLQARRLEEERQSSNTRPGAKEARAKRGQDDRSRGRNAPDAQAKKKQGRPGPSQRPAQAAREDDRDPVLQTIGMLQRRFPKAFPKKPDPKLPLKLGIYDDLMAQRDKLNVDETLLKNAIETWCKGSRYWACLVADAPRVDLAGEEAGTVTAHEAKYATVLARRRQQQARKSASRQSAAGPDASGDPASGQAADVGASQAAQPESPVQEPITQTSSESLPAESSASRDDSVIAPHDAQGNAGTSADDTALPAEPAAKA